MSIQQADDSALESERRYRQLRCCVADYFYHALIEGGRVVSKSHSAQCESLTGYRQEEFADRPELWNEIVVPEDRSAVHQQIERLLVSEDVKPIEYRLRHRNGKLRWVEKILVPYHDSAGRLTSYDSLLRDITERKEAEELLQQSEQRYRLLFEDDFTGDYLASPDGEILLCNPAFVSIFGFPSHAEAIGSNLSQLYEDAAAWTNLIAQVRALKFIERAQRVVRRSDGSQLHIIENVVGTFDGQDRLLRLKGYVFDDTDSHLEAIKLQKRNAELEQAVLSRTRTVREKHHQVEAIMNSAFDAIITIDRLGIIQTVNTATERIFGYRQDELVGHNVKLLMPSPYAEEHDGYLRRFLQTGEKRILDNARELVARRKDGSTFPVEVSITEVDHSQVFTGVVHDISERKQLQAHVLQIAADEQQRIGLELHDSVGQELTGLALHAGTLVELLESLPDIAAEGREKAERNRHPALRSIRDMAAKISERLNQTNRHVRELAHGIMPVQIEPKGLQTALEELVALTNAQCKIACLFRCPESVLVTNNTTATHLYCIAQEAINNAMRHSRATTIAIGLSHQNGSIVLEVNDNGVGFSHATQHSADGRVEPGMGVRTMQYRCNLVGGQFQLESEPGQGTTVKCLIPGTGRIYENSTSDSQNPDC